MQSLPPVLIAEDDSAIREALAELLAEDGFSVETAASGIEALAKLEARPGQPPVVLLDLHMPDMDGYVLLDRLDERPHCHGVPVIITSAWPRASLGALAERPGVVATVRKPFDLEELRCALRRAAEQLAAGVPLRPAPRAAASL